MSHNTPEVQDDFRTRLDGIERLQADDIAPVMGVMVTQDRRVAINELLVRPTE